MLWTRRCTGYASCCTTLHGVSAMEMRGSHHLILHMYVSEAPALPRRSCCCTLRPCLVTYAEFMLIPIAATEK